MIIRLSSKGLPRFCEQKHRTRGVHISSIIQDLFYDNGSLPDSEYLTLGRLVEDAVVRGYEREFPGRFIHEIELYYMGIYGTLDLYCGWHDRIHDIKFTMRSSKGPEVEEEEIAPPDHPIYTDKFRANWVQIACYIVMFSQGFDRIREGCLELCHARGDYTGFATVYLRWIAEFSREDLEQVWNMVYNHAVDNYCFTCGEKKTVCKGECN